MSIEAWFEDLQMLCNRFSHLGMGADLAALSITELRGLHSLLRRLAGKSDDSKISG